MNSASTMDYLNLPLQSQKLSLLTSNTFLKNERKLLKAFLIGGLHKVLCEYFENEVQPETYQHLESYVMDNKILQFLLRHIVETEEYTLEGIAYYTRIPLDVIVDVASGQNTQISATTWTRIIDLYIEVKPEISQALFNKLFTLYTANPASLTLLIKEP